MVNRGTRGKHYRNKNPPIFRTLKNPLGNIEAETTPEGRYYITEEGQRYLSVTTFLGSLPKPQYILDWVERVGKQQANKLKVQGANRGSRLHDNVEKYLLGKDVAINNPLDNILFGNMLPFLDRIDNVIAIEAAVYSDELQLAGRCDLIATVASIPYVIDFKTMTEQREIPEEYWLQVTAYSIMFKERTGIDIPRLCIAAVADDGHFQERHSERKLWKEKLKKMLTENRPHLIM